MIWNGQEYEKEELDYNSVRNLQRNSSIKQLRLKLNKNHVINEGNDKTFVQDKKSETV